jgi:hypothetical protein
MTARLRVLMNLTRPAFAVLLLAFGLPARAAGQEPPRDTTGASPRVKDLPLTAAQRQAFVGTYSVTATAGSPLPPDASMSFRVVEENGVLMAKGGDEEAKRLLYQGDNVFRPEGVRDVTLTVTFVVENGRATKFILRKEDGVIEGVRVP